jgi:hypothetical protein
MAIFGSARRKNTPPDFTELAQIISAHKAPMEELPANRGMWSTPQAQQPPPDWAPKKAGILDFILTGPNGARERNNAYREYMAQQQGQQDVQGLLQGVGEAADPRNAVFQNALKNPRTGGVALDMLPEPGKSQLFNTGDGGPIVRIGPDGRPQVVYQPPPRMPRAPQGYEWTPDGHLRYIPGGPGDPSVIGTNAGARRKPENLPAIPDGWELVE